MVLEKKEELQKQREAFQATIKLLEDVNIFINFSFFRPPPSRENECHKRKNKCHKIRF